MPLTQSINSKSNIKKLTNSDLPANLNQPVINSYYATSTASQTVINLSFTIDTTSSGYTDNFWLFVDGKKLRLGSSNDYTFTSVASDGTSSQVTLTAAISANLNIQAYKLGLKPEVQFGMDNRFVQLYSAQNAGFQGFVSQSDYTMTATTSVGAPAAGTFYSSITGRASMPDLSQDLKPRMGIERLMVQSVYQLQTEFGPNGEPIWANANDTFGQIRFGGQWSNNILSNGQFISSTTVGDFIEVTFYGTGLNLLADLSYASMDIRPSLDGGAEGSNIFASSYSSVLDTRYNNTNQVLPVYSNQTLGVHTVKLRNNSTNAVKIYGFEVLNESSLVKVTSGVGYVKGQQYTAAALQSFSYSAPVTGTRGGRVLTYLKSDGTIGQSFQAVNASAAYLTSADHTNEEVARRYYWREFGAGRSDDFSLLSTASSSRVFTLDDGTTTLVGQNVRIIGSGYDTLMANTTNDFVTFTFVGTGLDVELLNGSGANLFTYTPSIDGTALANFTPSTLALATAGSKKAVKIASGLPYGTHTFKYLRADNNDSIGINSFIVYQPKKPTPPSGAIELADYNVMANYDSSAVTDNTITGHVNVPQGTLFKSTMREFTYVGAGWSVGGTPDTNMLSGWNAGPATNNSQPASYTFFGTGFMLVGGCSSVGTYSINLQVDGANTNAAAVKGNITNTGSGGVYTTTSTTTDQPWRVELTGLTLGMHTVLVQRSAGTGNFSVDELFVITPIHSSKSNLYSDLQNTLPVGSQGISDNRKLTPVKDALPSQKARFQSTNSPGVPTTVTSTSYVPLPNASGALRSSGSWCEINFTGAVRNQTSGNLTYTAIFIDGVQVSPDLRFAQQAQIDYSYVAETWQTYLSPGIHKIDIYWKVNAGTSDCYNFILTGKEL